MELNWSTFILEIINFLVLVWILKRFLYQPVLNVIAQRRESIDKTLADARAMQQTAKQLQQKYESRLADWETERQQAREKLLQELEAEQARQQAILHNTLEQEREKARVTEQRRQDDVERKYEETALLQSAAFASRLLQQAAGPDVEARLAELLIDGLDKLPEERITRLRSNNGQTAEVIEVASAFPLPEALRQRLEHALIKVTGTDIPLQFQQNESLLAGLRITIGAWVISANLQDELKGFMEFAPSPTGSGLQQ